MKRPLLPIAALCTGWLLGTAPLAANAQPSSSLPYWQDIQVVEVNKERPRTEFMSYDNRQDALSGQFEKSKYYQLLNGTWKFLYVDSYKDLPAHVTDANADTPGVYAYLYPGNSTESDAYVLQGTWKGTQTVDIKSLASEALASGLQRGQQLNVMITLLGGEHEYKVNCQVNAWGEKVMTIPPFE